MSKTERRGTRVLWSDLCQNGSYKGRWVALDSVRYDGGVPVEGVLVDSDQDLAALCTRIQSVEDTACAILYCDDKASGAYRSVSRVS
jgi:hypothetical protein